MPRPAYLETYGVLPPSQSPETERATVEYHCNRLIALVNLYYWAMQWTLHAAHRWKLGEGAYPFELRQKELWAIGLETLEQAAKETWPADLKLIRVMVQQKRKPRRMGVIIFSNVHWGQYRKSLAAKAAQGDEFDSEPPEFVGEDLVLKITFPQRELLRGSATCDFGGATHTPKVVGRLVAIADVIGDWREEIITSAPGELRIYTTTIPARDRRPCLMQDPIYRIDVAVAAMGYYAAPMLSYDMASQSP